MSQRASGQVAETLNSLAELHFEGQSIDSLIAHIGRLALHTLQGWDAAAATLVTGDKVATYGATDDRVNPADQAQYDSNAGPCVDALKTAEVQYFDGNSGVARWREFAAGAAECGIHSTLSSP